MKKIFSLSLLLGLSQIFFSCTKDQSAAVTKSQGVEVSSSRNDSAKVSGNKQTLAVGCKNPSNVQVYPYAVGYTVIGTFDPERSVYLPKNTVWRAGSYSLNFQPDGNLVIYDGSGRAIWDCPQSWRHNPTFALQPDMNFVAYENGNPNAPIWAAGTQDFYCNGKMAYSQLILTNQGDLQIIAGGTNSYRLQVVCILASTESSQGKKTGTGNITKFATSDNPYGVALNFY